MRYIFSKLYLQDHLLLLLFYVYEDWLTNVFLPNNHRKMGCIYSKCKIVKTLEMFSKIMAIIVCYLTVNIYFFISVLVV